MELTPEQREALLAIAYPHWREWEEFLRRFRKARTGQRINSTKANKKEERAYDALGALWKDTFWSFNYDLGRSYLTLGGDPYYADEHDNPIYPGVDDDN